MIDARIPLPTPARTFVHRLTNTAEQYQVELAIARTQYNELHDVVTARTERKSHKRKSLQRQTVVSKLEFAEQEKARKNRKKSSKGKPSSESNQDVQGRGSAPPMDQ